LLPPSLLSNTLGFGRFCSLPFQSNGRAIIWCLSGSSGVNRAVVLRRNPTSQHRAYMLSHEPSILPPAQTLEQTHIFYNCVKVPAVTYCSTKTNPSMQGSNTSTYGRQPKLLPGNQNMLCHSCTVLHGCNSSN
jgi:hypothetical protein